MALTGFNIIELSTAVVTIAGGIALILRQIQQSRCKTCNLCCGMMKCDREVPQEIAVDVAAAEAADEAH